MGKLITSGKVANHLPLQIWFWFKAGTLCSQACNLNHLSILGWLILKLLEKKAIYEGGDMLMSYEFSPLTCNCKDFIYDVGIRKNKKVLAPFDLKLN